MKVENNCIKILKKKWLYILAFIILIIGIIILKNNIDKIFNFKFWNKKNEIIIGIDFGSTFSGYSIIVNSEKDIEDLELNDNENIIPTELIMDNETHFGMKIGQAAHDTPKYIIGKKNHLYFSKFKRNLDPKNNNNYAYSNYPEGEKIELEDVIKAFLIIKGKNKK